MRLGFADPARCVLSACMKLSKTLRLSILVTLFAAMAAPQMASAHCQVPCGIYGDHERVHALLEDAETVTKACKMMAELAGTHDAQSQQQFVRWVNNKESHAQKIIETMSDYYFTQRIKPSQEDYKERLVAHHAVVLAAMKAKQSADIKNAEALSKAISALMVYYPHQH